ncbi:MAG: gamma-glutamyltransferase [Gammaproteobacteria bacterium]|nr:gamma-glutamyltransferase [Gammaproteobacteria bacterium]
MQLRDLRVVALLALLCLAVGASASESPPKRPGQAAIASPHPLATRAGMEVLQAGGNAFDAAVAVSAALAVVEPYGSGLGGGGFWLLHRAEDRYQVMVDGRETAPGAAHRDMFLDDDGQPVPDLSRNSMLAAGIPGLPAGLVHLSSQYGRLPLGSALAPAIRYAEEGFEVYPRLLMGLEFKREQMLTSPAAAEVFLPGGELPELGSVLRQPDLARTLRRIVERGVEGFYAGPVAEALVAAVQAGGGIWTLEDLAGYRIVEREPVIMRYRDARIVAASLPSSGGVVLATVLNILDGYDLSSLSAEDATHLVIEAMRRGYRDRALYLGDPDFVDVPLEKLTHPLYAAGLRAGIRLDRALPSEYLPGIGSEPEGTQTTHFSIIDADGNRVGATQTLNFWYGNGLMAAGTGVLLNNEMDDFSAKPGVPDGFQLVTAQANMIEPHKRMLSSMTPTFIESPRGVAVLGTPGGSRIISMVLLGVLARVDEGASARQMVERRRFHHQYLPDRVVYETGAFDEATAEALRARGHVLAETSRDYGNLQVVTWDHADNRVQAASDPRGDLGEATEAY